MADDILLNAGSGGQTLATDQAVGGEHYQQVKLVDGTADSTTVIASGGGVEAAALRVTIASDSTGVVSIDDNGGSLTVDGTVTANLSATDNAVLDAIAASVASMDSNLGGTSAVDSVAGASDSGAVMLAVRDDALTTLTPVDGDYVNLRVNSTGALWTAVNGTVTVDGSGVTQPVSAASLPLPTGAASETTLSTLNGKVTACDTGAVVISSGAVTSTLAAETTKVIGTVNVAAGQTIAATNAGTFAVQVDAALPAGTNNIGDVDVTSLPRATSHYRNIDANAEAEIKGSAGTLYWVHVMNMTAAVAYAHLYDATAASVTPGTTTPNYTFPIPTAGSTNGAGFNLPLGGAGTAFANGITLVVTTTTDGSTGDPGTNGVFVNAGYA